MKKIAFVTILLSAFVYGATTHNHDHTGHNHGEHNSLYGNIGLFGKTSALATSKENANRDSYSFAYLNLIFGNTLENGIDFNLGITARGLLNERSKFGDNKENYGYVGTSFIPHIANVGIQKDILGGTWGIKLGRLAIEKQWIGHYIQGAYGYIDYKNVDAWLLWADEQSHITREFSTDFTYFKGLYDSQNLFATGVEIDAGPINLQPYFYFLNRFASTPGAKVSFEIGDRFKSHTFINYAYLHSLYKAGGHEGHHHEDGGHEGHGHYEPGGSSYIAWIQQRFTYEDFISFGAGFWAIGRGNFHLANMESGSIFESHEHSHEGFGVLQPGGLHNGSQTTSAYNGGGKTSYAFVEVQIDKIALALIGRNSNDKEITQNALSLGIKYNIFNGFELGGVLVGMNERHKDENLSLNRSYTKGYIQYSF